MSRLAKHLVRFRQVPLAEKWMVVEAAWELARARGRVKFSKFSRWKHRLGTVTALPKDGDGGSDAVDPAIVERADRIGAIIRAVAKRMPFTANCLPQATAAQTMLMRRGIDKGKLYLGGQKGNEEKPFLLHAWLFVGPVCVTGDDGPGDLKKFKPLAVYTFDKDALIKTAA